MTPTPTDTARSILRNDNATPQPADIAALKKGLETTDRNDRRLALNALRLVATHAPGLVRSGLDDDTLRSLCSDTDPTVRADSADLLATLVTADTHSVTRSVTLETLTTLLEDDTRLVRTTALEGLHRIVSAVPETAPPLVAAVEPFLDADSEATRRQTVDILASAATQDGGSVSSVASHLLEVCRDDRSSSTSDARRSGIDSSARERIVSTERDSSGRHRSIRQLSGHALCQLAIADPDSLAPLAADLAALLEDSDPGIRTVVVQTFIALADARPDAVMAHRNALRVRLESDESPTTRAAAAQALSALGQAEPDAVGACALECLGALGDLLDHDEPPVRGAAANLVALARVTSTDSDVIAPIESDLEALRDDDVAYVRASAIDALETGRSQPE